MFAAWQRMQDWREARAKLAAQRALEKRRIKKPLVTTQLVQARGAMQTPRTGIEKAAMEERDPMAARIVPPQPSRDYENELAPIEVSSRAAAEAKPKTAMPLTAASLSIPS